MRKRKEIPARIFHKLWDASLKADSREFYLREYATISTVGLKLGKYNLNDKDSFDVVSKIYDLSHKKVSEIAKDAGLKKAGMGHLFCIPKRTLEEWYKNDARCPSYIKLSMMRQLNQFDIGKDIHVEGFDAPRTMERGADKRKRVNGVKNSDDSIMRLVSGEGRKNVADSIGIRKLLEQTEHIGEQLRKREEKANQRQPET